MSKPLEVTDATFEAQVLKANTPVLVDFWAAWCGPCKMIAPVVEELAKDYAGKLKVCKLNVDENNQTTALFGVMSIPTLILFKDGKPVERLVGYMPKAKLVEKLSPHLPK
ncbi:MAG: thioredoxin [Anaerolineae bacterium]